MRRHYGGSTSVGRRRADKNQYGFVLDIERGYWQRNDLMPDDDDVDQLTRRIERVIPYVEDRRNSLIFEPKTDAVGAKSSHRSRTR